MELFSSNWLGLIMCHKKPIFLTINLLAIELLAKQKLQKLIFHIMLSRCCTNDVYLTNMWMKVKRT